jgi:quercetin dioxygenase-like cupin family protein
MPFIDVNTPTDSKAVSSAIAPGAASRMGTTYTASRPGAWRRLLVATLAFGLTVGSVATVYAAAGAPAPQQVASLEPFEAVGLPAGEAKGVPSRLSLPAGTSLKHIHGGPTYVYVLSGSLNIIDNDGSTAAYTTGDFFPEAPGHIHTVQTAGGAEVFILQFLPPGAESLVPVQ